MKGYLLDTNILRFWFDRERPEHESVARRVSSLPAGSILAISAITLGEIEFGYRARSDERQKDEDACRAFIQERIPLLLLVGKHTRNAYGPLRARLFERFSPASLRKKVRRPEQLVDPVTSLELGIQENDLWIASQAIEHNLVLATHDKMLRIREAAPQLRTDDWAQASQEAS